MTTHTVGTREEWLAARKELLEAEKEHMRRGDELVLGAVLSFLDAPLPEGRP